MHEGCYHGRMYVVCIGGLGVRFGDAERCGWIVTETVLTCDREALDGRLTYGDHPRSNPRLYKRGTIHINLWSNERLRVFDVGVASALSKRDVLMFIGHPRENANALTTESPPP